MILKSLHKHGHNFLDMVLLNSIYFIHLILPLIQAYFVPNWVRFQAYFQVNHRFNSKK